MQATIEEIQRITRNFMQPARTRVFKGGRGSGKTRALALRSGLRVYQLAELGVEGVFLASREHLNSLDESSMEEIKAAIRSVPWLVDYFDIGEKYIRTRNRRISYAFAGLRHNLDSIKSKARIIGNWTDEAENVSEVAWRKLIPTIREEGAGWMAENWISYNPESSESATHRRFVAQPANDCRVTEVNWQHNRWFPDILNLQRLEDQRIRPEVYDHIWGGAFLTLTDAQIFGGKFSVDEFEPDENWQGPYHGLDFGFANDPSVAVQVYIHANTLYIRREAGRTKLELDATGDYMAERIPSIQKHVIRADSARPESISYLKRHGLPQIIAVEKWPGSVEDGIDHIKSYEKVVIHPECPATAREFRLYSYKVDRNTGDILRIVVDDHNHYIDALRYALGPMIKARGAMRIRAL
jgi:phage terminase large subunit